MSQWNIHKGRKASGSLLHKISKKKKFQRSRDFLPTHIAESRVSGIRTRAGGEKLLVLSENIANVISGGKAKKAKIMTVTENKSNAQFARRNIITKGAIIQTELGKARVTSRPGRDGVINAVLIEKK
jgi:small subunit ribosomal protein S8e